MVKALALHVTNFNLILSTIYGTESTYGTPESGVNLSFARLDFASKPKK